VHMCMYTYVRARESQRGWRGLDQGSRLGTRTGDQSLATRPPSGRPAVLMSRSRGVRSHRKCKAEGEGLFDCKLKCNSR
jgi:hypothetical protein